MNNYSRAFKLFIFFSRWYRCHKSEDQHGPNKSTTQKHKFCVVAIWWPLWIEWVNNCSLVNKRQRKKKTTNMSWQPWQKYRNLRCVSSLPSSTRQTKICIITVSDVTLLLKETLIIWEIIQESVMSAKVNSLLRNQPYSILNLVGHAFHTSFSITQAFINFQCCWN